MNLESEKLPAGKNRTFVTDTGEQRILIGKGEHSNVYKILEGPLAGLVCRSPLNKASELNTEKVSLLRFRRHQIAHAMFPEYVLDVRMVNLDRREMLSREVIRSKENLRDCTRVGLSRRRERTLEPLDPSISSIAKMMNRAGIQVEANKPNVSVVKNNGSLSICFFEIKQINCEKISAWIERQVPPASGVSTLLRMYKFEAELADIELMMLFRDGTERENILYEHHATDLASIYEKEIGKKILASW